MVSRIENGAVVTAEGTGWSIPWSRRSGPQPLVTRETGRTQPFSPPPDSLPHPSSAGIETTGRRVTSRDRPLRETLQSRGSGSP